MSDTMNSRLTDLGVYRPNYLKGFAVIETKQKSHCPLKMSKLIDLVILQIMF